jgi:negative modulator of initiation of replication
MISVSHYSEAPMRTVELDDDVYAHLLGHVDHIGESASSILRRLLNLGAAAGAVRQSRGSAEIDDDGEWLLKQIENESFRLKRTATDKYLFVLGCAHERAPDRFAKILTVSGRKRKYFGASEADIASSGSATYPQRIPGTRYWAMTNASTNDKRDILRQVLQQLGYKPLSIERVTRVIE